MNNKTMAEAVGRAMTPEIRAAMAGAVTRCEAEIRMLAAKVMPGGAETVGPVSVKPVVEIWAAEGGKIKFGYFGTGFSFVVDGMFEQHGKAAQTFAQIGEGR